MNQKRKPGEARQQFGIEFGQGTRGIPPWVTTLIALVVTVVWVIAVVLDMVSRTYNPPPTIHIAFMTVLGGIIGFKVAGK